MMKSCAKWKMTKFDIFVVNLKRSADRREAMREKIARIRGFKEIYIDDELVCKENSSLGAPCGDFGNLGRFADAPVQSHAPNSQKTPQLPPQNTRIVDLDSSESNDSSLRENERIIDSHEAIQNKNQSARSAHRISPDSWCKKSKSKGAVVPPADFLLESELRGSPPKSEKAAAFWRVGGAGRGVQPFLRKENCDKDSIDLKVDSIAESSLRGNAEAIQKNNIYCHDSTTNLTQNFRLTERSEVSKSRDFNQIKNKITQERINESHKFAQSKKIVGDSQIAKIDSSLTAFAQNDESVDCHDSAFAESRNDGIGVDCFGDESPCNDGVVKSPQDEFAEIALHFHFFDATDATKFKNGESPLPPQYSSKLTRFVKGKDLSFGEIAIFSSSYRLWQKCVELDSSIIVLEDDIDFMQDFCQIVDIFKSPFEYVRLRYTIDKKITHLYDRFYISFDRIAGAQGYYLTPQAAQKFIKNARFWLFCVDDYMDMFFIHSVKNIIFKPFIISEDSLSAGTSTILGREKPQMRFYQKLTRELSRIYFFVIRKYMYFTLHCVELRAFFRANRR